MSGACEPVGDWVVRLLLFRVIVFVLCSMALYDSPQANFGSSSTKGEEVKVKFQGRFDRKPVCTTYLKPMRLMSSLSDS